VEYRTIFDVLDAGYRQWTFPAFGLIFIAAGIAIPHFIRSGLMRQASERKLRWFRPIFIGFATLWTLGSFASTYSDYRRAVHALQSGQAHVVEGPITDYQIIPMKSESFTVQGVRFRVSDYEVTAGFNNMASHGGPIRVGLPVKIWYLEGEILRLQIKEA
jgi:hypothetical protein